MSSTRPAVTPATSPSPTPVSDNAILSSTPPRSAHFAGGGSRTSPSPRTRLGSRDLGQHPGPRNQHFDAIDTNSPATPQAPFPPNPPRTSSLLPPARIISDPVAPQAGPLLRDPFNDPRPAPRIPDSAREFEPQHRRGHSRSSSAGGLTDTLRNLNRWSASTTSSRASNIAGFTKRVSAEFLGAAFSSPGRKAHKRRPSTSGGSPRSFGQRKSRDESPAPGPEHVPALQSLPRISTGPSLEHEVFESNMLGGFSPVETLETARPPSQDTGAFWDAEPRGWEGHLASSAQPPHPVRPPPPTEMISPEPTMSYTHNGGARAHSRSRSSGAKGSVDRTRERDWDHVREKDRERPNKPPSQKAMLSRALQKARTAVQLDNAQNFEGARTAYAEACAVLQQVLQRTTGEDDRNKLEAIHETYLARVMELDEQLVDVEPEGKALPQRPQSNDLHDVLNAQVPDHDYLNPYSSARGMHYEDDPSIPLDYSVQEPSRAHPSAPKGTPSLFADTSRDARDGPGSYLTQQHPLQSAFSRARNNNGSTLRPPMDNAYMPPPLSPLRPLSPARPPAPVEPESPMRADHPEIPTSSAQLVRDRGSHGHQRANSHESVSWLDPIDESEHSSTSSVHSRSSSRIRRKHVRVPSGATEAEFDAALDDAIEAAYDDGYEPESQEVAHVYPSDHSDPMANTLRRVAMAREMVRESEREALELANERERRLRQQQQQEDEEYRRHLAIGDDFYDGNESDMEERFLEEMTKGNAIEDFTFGARARPPVPRESDSSGMTSRTWHSSVGSNPHTSTTLLTPVSEISIHPHPTGPLPALPTQSAQPLPPQPHTADSQTSSFQSVRSRRLSGQNAKELKIETTKLTATAPPATAGAAIPSQPKPGNYILQQRQALSAGPNRTAGPFSPRPTPSPVPAAPTDDAEETDPVPPMGFSHEDQLRVGTPSVVRQPNLKKNFSASSLRSLKTRNLSISHTDEPSEFSPGTPVGNQYGIGGSFSRLPSVPSIPSVHAATASDRANSTATSGLHLFDNHFHSPDRPGSPNPALPDAPAPLEPCPSDTLLRPFWLMRCLYQSLCHPRGGYLSNKLFVPRDVWRVKGVKLKGIEDKIANCDYLTAALQKLARVDTFDADAVLEEMQALEGVIEHAQAALTRKLGSDVGVQGTSAMFRDAGAADPEAAAMPRSGSVAGKGSSFSWRRLRSKNSSANLPGLPTAYGGKAGSGVGASSVNLADGTAGRDTLLASLPMTANPTSRPAKRDVNSVGFAGPNANYMASLARLFDAAQTIDQIARQVNDPGLRHADKTQVGIELVTRQAAEFFAFYICRFALSDLSMLLDKFIKRGSEWVLA
ncbi:hypothetical protein BT67DRAFT_434561 [Trichocladium antarcticum]|uniref:MIT domain-containing protein n=1 Tax=Trichocladium antarcticum TaxID=1450529 RepID=A0AAN6ZDL8_9PEZI|nr:hypothetical protein BT67DRAFT_434561 [Trichocladium antarcticum]